MRENAGQGRGSTKHHIHQFIESRINDPAIDQEQLATWIFRLAPLDDRAKIRFLLKIQVPNVCHFLNILVVQNERDRADVIHQLGVHPNPALDKFVIDTYNWYRSPQAHGCWLLNLTDALVRIDTLAVRKLITGEWDEAGNTRLSLLSHLISGSSVVRWRQPNMNWLVPMIAELNSKRELNLAVNLLARIDTPEAYELAEKWTTDPDSDIAEAAAEQLKIRDQRAAQRQQQLAQAADLLAGNIKPDDLLPTPTAYTWNGTEYLPGDASE